MEVDDCWRIVSLEVGGLVVDDDDDGIDELVDVAEEDEESALLFDAASFELSSTIVWLIEEVALVSFT